MKHTRLFMYLRKSSESEDRQSASIPAQQRELNQLVERLGLTIVGEPLVEEMSAKKPGRPVFDSMLRAIENKKAEGILCWHLNRLARNPLDGGRLMQALGDGVIKEIVTPGRGYSNADDKLMMAIEFGMSTKYVDDLRRDIARGRRQSLESGRWPSGPKLGYVWDRNLRLHVPDPARFGLTQDLLHRRLAGERIDDIIQHGRTVARLATPRRGKVGGSLLSRSLLYRVFRDPFYAGIMRFNGLTYNGRHVPMITWTEHEKIQASLDTGKTNTPKAYQHDFLYRGLVRCGACGALATGQYTTNRFRTRYTYYRCCRRSRTYRFCPEPALQETAITNALSTFFATVELPGDVLEWVRETLPTVLDDLVPGTEAARTRLLERVAATEHQRERLRLLCAEEIITSEEYTRDRERLLAEARSIHEQVSVLDDRRRRIQPWIDATNTAEQAVLRFGTAVPRIRREMIRNATSNLSIKGGKAAVQAAEPFVLFQHLKRNPTLWTNKDYLRTLCASGGFLPPPPLPVATT